MSRRNRFTLDAFLVTVCLAGLISSPAASEPIRIVDRGSRSEWIEYRAWGGGARFVFELPPRNDRNSRALDFLAGGAPEFAFGCTSLDPSKSYWRFRVEFSAPGTGIAGQEEAAYEAGIARVLGAPGEIILFDEIDKEMRRMPLRPTNNGLETDRLTEEEVDAFLSASAIRAATPLIVFESGTLMLKSAIDIQPNLPCRAR